MMSRFGTLLVVAFLFVSVTAFAQESSEPPATPAPAPRRHPQVNRAEQRLKRLSKRLNLTDDQKEKLRPILQDEQKQLQAIDDDTSLTPQQKHRKVREIRLTSRSQMDGILTDEQKKLLPSQRTPHGGGHHARRSQPGSGTTVPDQNSPQ
jgi:Spy/CpxP family protein refolding chaperone